MNQTYPSKITSLANYPIVINETLLKVIGVFIFVILTTLGAFVRIPLIFTPVPITLQTFFVLLSGAMLGRKFGTLSQSCYLALGACGIPLFAGATSGMSVFLGPTGGYLFGFVIASFLVGALLKNNKNLVNIISIFLLTSAVILILGALWLCFVLKINFSQALYMGVLPFVGGDIIKAIAASLIFNKLKYRF